MKSTTWTLAAIALAIAGCQEQTAQQAKSRQVAAPLADSGDVEENNNLYIVRLADRPLATYRGGLAGLAATSPTALGGGKLDLKSPASVAYLQHLAAAHRAFETAAEAALGRDVTFAHQYRYAFNGVALELNEAEAAKIERIPGVARVQRPFTRHIATDAGPRWIGAPSVWNGSATDGAGSKGEGVVVGVIDTGINHDHPSFADVGGDGHDHENPRGTFYGLCDPIAGLPLCNDKLIGVWDFTGTGPNDEHGHGSHTASTSAGNFTTARMEAPTLTLERDISGVAPHANIIAYKGCTAAGSCIGASLTAAIDQATADGVDVINYSIGGGPSNPWDDSDSEAFLAAREAGVFVATSAGNSGPGAATVGSPANAPWVTSVGASTHSRTFVSTLAGMEGGASAPPADLKGKSVSAGYGPAPIVHARDFGDGGCMNPFAPGTFNGQIVICDRGVIPRVNKGLHVLSGGAGGLVLANTEADGDSTVADPHHLPAVHIGYTDAKALDAWISQGSGHTGTITATTAEENAAIGDVMASFSSRGENAPAPGLIKPDITAPGVDVLAAAGTPAEFVTMSGTSMSSPHLAGAAALVRAVHPDWTPSQVKSAIMTTAKTEGVRKEDGVTPSDPFDRGAGRVDLTRAARAGLVLDETHDRFLAANPAAGGDPSALNVASLGDATCAGTCTWRRTLTSVASADRTWTVTVDAPAGMAVEARLDGKKTQVKLAPGESVDLTVTANVGDLPRGTWVFAEVRLTEKSDRAPAVHLPVAVLPGGVPTDVQIETSSTQGQQVVSMTAYAHASDLTARVYGLERDVVSEQILTQDPTSLEPYDGLGGTFHVLTNVEAGSRLLVAEVVETSSSDVDLFVGRDADGDGEPDASEEVCRSASEKAAGEKCRMLELEPGSYWIMVQNWLTGQGADTVKLVVSKVPGTDNGNLAVTAPSVVAAGSVFDVTLDWSNLASGTSWSGLVELHATPDSPANVGSMLLSVDVH